MRIAATAAIPAIGHEAFAELGEIEELDWPVDRIDAEVLLVRGETVTASAIAAATGLKLIARTGSGLDNVDLDAATRAGIPVLFAPKAGARPVAEGTIALIVAAAKRMGELADLLRRGAWGDRYAVAGLDLSASVLGLVGYGEVGREVARMARSLDMDVIATDPGLSSQSIDQVPLVSLDELLAAADVVSLHCPLTPETEGIVDAEFLGKLKAGAVLVNAARGRLVADESLLLGALDDERLSALGLDVFAQEPPAATNPLLSHPRVICTPHSIGLTQAWNRRIFFGLADDIARYFRGEPVSNVARPIAGTSAAPTAAGSDREP